MSKYDHLDKDTLIRLLQRCAPPTGAGVGEDAGGAAEPNRARNDDYVALDLDLALIPRQVVESRMMRLTATALLLAAVGCAGTAGKEVVPTGELARAAVLQEINGYAMASCLAYSSEPHIQREGYGWASVVVQRVEGGIDTLAGVAEAVKAETLKRTPLSYLMRAASAGKSSCPHCTVTRLPTRLRCGQLSKKRPVDA